MRCRRGRQSSPREKPSRDQNWWEWLLAVPATTIRKLLSYATRADLWPGPQPSVTLTCEKCGARVKGERGLKIHLQQWCGQSAREAQTASRLEAKTGMQGSERVKKWPCSHCQKEFSTRSNRIAHERASCRNILSPLSLSTNQQAQEQAPSVPEATVDNTKVPVSQLASASDVSAQAPTRSTSIFSDHAVSAPAQTNDSEIAATSAQLQIEEDRQSDHWDHRKSETSRRRSTSQCL